LRRNSSCVLREETAQVSEGSVLSSVNVQCYIQPQYAYWTVGRQWHRTLLAPELRISLDTEYLIHLVPNSMYVISSNTVQSTDSPWSW
jgi:hypothetical protein